MSNLLLEWSFLGGFVKFAKSDCYLRHVFLSVTPSALNNSAPTERIFMKFGIYVFFEHLSRQFKFH